MNLQKEIILNTFINSINQLYSDIHTWLQSTELMLSKEQHEIIEDFSGPYHVDILNIYDKTKELLGSLKPVSAKVVAAHGRIDLIGLLDRVVLIYYQKNELETNQKDGVSIFYKGMDQAGWYWVEDSRRQKAHLLNKELFFELLTEISDYVL